MSGLRQRLASLVDPTVPDETKLKALQEVSDGFDSILSSQHYVPFLDTAVPKFLQFLKDGKPVFQSDNPTQQLRKLVLELIHRLPSTEHLRQFVKPILSVMFGLLEEENEENSLVCLRIIIELHKQFRPAVSGEVTQFLLLVKNVYSELPKNMVTLFETSGGLGGGVGMGGVGGTGGVSEMRSEPGGGDAKSTVLAKGVTSLKVLAELPIVVVLMYQLFKQTVHSTVAELIPLTTNTLILSPSPQARNSPSFNKETYVDFVAVQIKFLSFLAYVIRIYQEQVNQHSQRMVQGMLALLRNCPEEVPHLRRELLIATRHILNTDLRKCFVSVIDQFFDEEVLIGPGWTARETIRSLAYSILADLVHHLRGHISLNHLTQAVQLFSRNIHDDSLPTSIQIMSCKLLLNLVESIRQKSEQDAAARDVLIRMMECFIEKFHTIAEHQIKQIFSKCVSADSTAAGGGSQPQPSTSAPSSDSGGGQKPGSLPATGSSGAGSHQLSTVTASNIADCRAMVKTLVSGMKTIVWGAGSCKLPGSATAPQHPQKVFLPRETVKFIALLKYALVALDIYRIVGGPNGQFLIRSANVQTVKTKEEKEVLENFATTFTMISLNTFKEIFVDKIEYLVHCIQGNYALQVILNTFLANPTTSAAFATILLNYLLKKMAAMGCDSDDASLYLKLFKLVFSSVSLFPQDNEMMLKPNLHMIVNQSTQLAITAKDPYNYFLLLRALFRSIGGGSHELLYQEFLPLLSNLLQGLNRLQSGIHKSYMKDLFVELCLTVPVRLSSLLPYLHMLMDPLVSALNGSQTLVSQGLRTLELCVDNLQPDFLYEHIQPVRAELMQSLWRTLHNQDDNIAQTAFRVLGKFGGSNRKMLEAPQKLTFVEYLHPGPGVCLHFLDHETTYLELPLDKCISEAVKVLSMSTSESFYRQQAWYLLQGYLTSMIGVLPEEDLHKHFANVNFEPVELLLNRLRYMTLPMCPQKGVRECLQSALLGMLYATSIPELQKESSPFVVGVVRHMAMIAVLQQCGQNSIFGHGTAQDSMDVFVLVDAIADCICLEEKETARAGEMALGLILDTSTVLMGDKEKAVDLPLFTVICDKICGCCYRRAWFAKSGGCSAIAFLVDKMPLKWIMTHQLAFIMALMFVLQDLANDVSSGTLDHARELIERILRLCNKGLDHEPDKMKNIQSKSFYSVARHLVKEVISSNENLRKQSHASLKLLAEITGKTITEIMEPHKEILADMIPPKKHLLKHQPIVTQIALMDGNTFCTSLTPRLFTIDLSIHEHKVFFNELYTLCDTEDAVLARTPCYKSVTSLVPLRKHAIAALAACHYISASDVREKIFSVLHKAITSNSKELQEAGKEAMKKFMAEHMDIELVHTALRPLLLMLADYRHLNTSLLQRLTIMISLFPNSFNEKMCDQLLAHLHRWVEVLTTSAKQVHRSEVQEVPICLSIMEMLHMLPASSFKLADALVSLCFKAEAAIGVEVGSPFREPLFKFVVRFPQQTVDYFLASLVDSSKSSLFLDFLRNSDAEPLREALYSASTKIVDSAFVYQIIPGDSASLQKQLELRHMGIIVTKLLIKHNEKWFSQSEQQLLVEHLKKIWMSQDYHSDSNKITPASLAYWDEKKHLVKCLIAYVRYNPDDVELLFHLLRAFATTHATSFHFLSHFLESHVAKEYSIEQKRNLFFKFVTFYHDAAFPHELKAQALQHILIPVFTSTFEDGKGDELIGGPPNPDQDSDENIVSVYINQVINPEKPLGSADPLSILLLQFSRILVEHAAPHIHDSNNKRQGDKLRRIMTFAWPCLLPRQCVDPATKYHGLLLLAHIIAKFAIHKRIVLQVFHTLLKGYAPEARLTVRQALDILTPVVPVRMEDSNVTLVHWTKKVIVEEGHSVNQLVHILQLIVRHYKVYYPVRQHLVQHMVSSIQRLGFIANATLEHRKLAVDLAEVIVKWEFQRVREQQDHGDDTMDTDAFSDHPSSSLSDPKKQSSSAQGEGAVWVMEKQHVDAVINFLLRLACQVNDLPTSTTPGPSPGEALSKRCGLLVRTALKPEIWPNIDIKLSWFDKLLSTVDQQPPSNYGSTVNICTGLDLLTFLLTVLPHSTLLSGFRLLHKGIMACITTMNMKVVRYVHALLSRLMQIFPMEPAAGFYCKHEELDILYSTIAKFVHDGLTSYDKSTSAAPTQLQSTLIILKSVCTHEPACVDRFIGVFMKVIQKLHKEHISNLNSPPDGSMVSEMLQLCIEMVKTRVGVMQQDYRKAFLTIVSALIEKSPDVKLLRTITKVIDEWIRSRNDTPGQSTSPSLREKTILLTRLMTFLEKRFADDTDLHSMFLETVLFVYKDPVLSVSELSNKLEPAFLSGLKFPQPQTRAKFFEVYEASIHSKLYERLVFITCSQNWEYFGHHFWIKQCIELVMGVSNLEIPPTATPTTSQMPPITSISSGAISTNINEPPTISTLPPEDIIEGMDTGGHLEGSPVSKEDLLNKHTQFLTTIKTSKIEHLVKACVHLCHNSSNLAHDIWIQLFPRVWLMLTDRQRQTLSNEIGPFMCSGSHVIQGECHPSALEAFLEGVAQCNPPIHLRSNVLKYLCKTHNAWHRSALLLEDRAIASGDLDPQQKSPPSYTGDTSSDEHSKTETLDSLSDLYCGLKEDDMWTGLWVTRCRFPETVTAVMYESQGLFEQARPVYEKAMRAAKDLHTKGPAPSSILSEYKLWETEWIRCAQELGQWDSVIEFGKTIGNNPFNIIDNAWRNCDWVSMKEGIAQAEQICPEALIPKLQLYRGYVAICPVEDQHLSLVEKILEAANMSAIRQWKRLPLLVSNTHVPLLQLSQQIIELQEGGQIQNILQPSQIGRSSTVPELKTFFKTWKNRLPIVSDDLSHWSDVLWWRQIHFKAIGRAFETNPLSDQAVHHSAYTTFHFASIARKHSSLNLAISTVTSPPPTSQSIHPMDQFFKVKQTIKSFMKLSSSMTPDSQQKAIDYADNTDFKFFTKEQQAEFFSLKGMLNTYFGRSEDANKCFSAAVQLCDSHAKCWGAWADYLNMLFIQERLPSIALPLLVCCLHACRSQGESKCRKYIARILWLVMFDDDKNTLADQIEKNSHNITPAHWLPWIPQLLTGLVKSERILNVLLYISKAHPQAVYFPIRTLYLTLKMEQKEKMRSEGSATGVSTPTAPRIPASPGNIPPSPLGTTSSQDSQGPGTPTSSGDSQSGSQPTSSDQPTSQRSAPAPPAMVRCSRIMQFLRDVHPTLLSTLEGIVDQWSTVCFQENWSEEILRLLMETLEKCYVVAFQTRLDVSGAKVTSEIEAELGKLVNLFGKGLGQSSMTGGQGLGLGKRPAGTSSSQDPTLQRLKMQFMSDFDLSGSTPVKLHSLISRLKKWIRIFEMKTKSLPRFTLLEDRCRFLSNFSVSTAEVDIPGEYLQPKQLPYMVHIARFMPHVEIVRRHNIAIRRLFIRGDNGKIYPYMVVNSSSPVTCRREERVLQLLRMMNLYLAKKRETSRRHLMFSAPSVVAVSPNMRLVEDNTSNASLTEIFQQFYLERGIESDPHLTVYYEKLAQIQSHDSQLNPVVLQQVFSEIQNNWIPTSVVKNWALKTYPNATNYWTFRKQVTNQLSLSGLVEFVLHLTRLDPDMLLIARDTGSFTHNYFNFDIDSSGHLDANRPVPFRLSSGLQGLIGTLGKQGPLMLNMVAIARCLVEPKFDFPGLLKAILRDEYIIWCKQRAESETGTVVSLAEIPNEEVTALVEKAVVAILTRLHNLASFEGAESKVSLLITAAEASENLSRMDPVWNPWL